MHALATKDRCPAGNKVNSLSFPTMECIISKVQKECNEYKKIQELYPANPDSVLLLSEEVEEAILMRAGKAHVWLKRPQREEVTVDGTIGGSFPPLILFAISSQPQPIWSICVVVVLVAYASSSERIFDWLEQASKLFTRALPMLKGKALEGASRTEGAEFVMQIGTAYVAGHE